MNAVPKTTQPLFHLAFPVHELAAAKNFYAGLLNCAIGRESDRWIDFDFFGHQITAHLVEEEKPVATNSVDGHAVPVRHFGLILDWDHWHSLAEHLKKAGADFVIEPGLRFQGQVGEQATLFIRDPSGNALEFKSFRERAAIFARNIS